MNYKYCENDNFEDLACGRVLIHRGGYPNFPVRLAQEIFCRCVEHLGKASDISLYDPCCGGGYLLTVLGLLNPEAIKSIAGSDISENALELAMDNLSLLTPGGIDSRIAELKKLYDLFEKNSHLQACESALRLKGRLPEKPIDYMTFRHDIFDCDMPVKLKADIVFFDVPYGSLAHWQGKTEKSENLLNCLLPVLNKNSVIALCSDKSQNFNSDSFTRLEKQLIGKRKFQIFAPYK